MMAAAVASFLLVLIVGWRWRAQRRAARRRISSRYVVHRTTPERRPIDWDAQRLQAWFRNRPSRPV
jgi:hypothetical protein